MTPFPVILSSPSGGGKTTIARRILAARRDIGYSVSATTRERRAGEVDGADYHFLSPHVFQARRASGEFAECAEVHGHWYGTLRTAVQAVLGTGRHVMMDIDVQGARQFRAAFPTSVLIFVLPPSVQVLIERLRARNSETEDSIGRRLRSALLEIEAVGEYDYVVVNDDLTVATTRVSTIIDAEAARVGRAHGIDETAAQLVSELRRVISATEQE